jgi:hypothetical protein
VEGEDFDEVGFEGLVDALRGWAADERAAAAAGNRRRLHWLRQQAAESATLAGVLLDLSERAAPVTVETLGGTHEGWVEVVSTGLCALRRSDRGLTLVALPAVTAIRTDAELPTGDRVPELTLDMAAALAALSADRCEVMIELAGGASVKGALERVGVELVAVRTGADGTVLIVMDGVTACVL